MAGLAGWAVLSAGQGLVIFGQATLHAAWLVPGLMTLHLVQLWISAAGWRVLLPGNKRERLFALRIVREGIDSLLPVAQMGGEVVGAQLLARHGRPLAITAASVVVDVTLEFLSQATFLLLGLLTLAATDGADWRRWVGGALLTTATLAGFVAAQRVGLLRLLEALAQQIAARWPAASALAGLDRAAAAIYHRPRALLAGFGLHLFAWLLGTIETWAVLSALGWPVGPWTALVVESLGMAARSAGFAIPGALVVQETGFALAAAAVGLPRETGLSLSVIKRVREVAVGLIGLLLWQAELRRGRRQAVETK